MKTTVLLEFSTKKNEKSNQRVSGITSTAARLDIIRFFLTAKDCGALKSPSNGSLVGNLTTYPYMVQFVCDEGFKLRGSKTRQCLSTGNWSGNESFCEGTTKCGENVIYRKQLSP